MSKKIVAFGASSSRQSINKQFAKWAARQIVEAEVTLLDLNDYEMPIFSVDKEREQGIPVLAKEFKVELANSDGTVISFAEHNGAYAAAFKNIMDWVSRIDGDVWANKPMLLLATSPGGRGGKTVLDIAVNKFGFMNKNTIASFSLPSFSQNFDADKGIVHADLLAAFNEQLAVFEQALAVNPDAKPAD